MCVIGLSSKTLEMQRLTRMQHTVRWLSWKKNSIFFVTPHWRGTYLTYFHDEQLDLPSVKCLQRCGGGEQRIVVGEYFFFFYFAGGRRTDMENRETQMGRVKWRRWETEMFSPLQIPSLSEQQEKTLVPSSQACRTILRSLQKDGEIDSQTPINQAVMYPHLSVM